MYVFSYLYRCNFSGHSVTFRVTKKRWVLSKLKTSRWSREVGGSWAVSAGPMAIKPDSTRFRPRQDQWEKILLLLKNMPGANSWGDTIATAQPEKAKDPHAQAPGANGGRARSQAMSEVERAASARQAAVARWPRQPENLIFASRHEPEYGLSFSGSHP
jgi:hypothetical protein